ncbi:MAG: MotE family protein [Pseudomonadota bacterium]
MRNIFRTRKARLTPVIMTALFALASLKAAGLWVSFSQAGAEETVAAAPIPLTPASERRSETSDRLLEQLAARNSELDAREADLDTRESLIEAAELRLESALNALREEKAALALAETDRARERRDEIGVLSNAYERMKARDAARIFEVLDDDILIPVAAGMRTQALAGVLAEMAPEKAKALTIALANREAAPAPAPKEVQ